MWYSAIKIWLEQLIFPTWASTFATNCTKSAAWQQTNENALQSWRVIAIERRPRMLRRIRLPGSFRNWSRFTENDSRLANKSFYILIPNSLSFKLHLKWQGINRVYMNYPVNLFSQMGWVRRAYMDRTPLSWTSYKVEPPTPLIPVTLRLPAWNIMGQVGFLFDRT